MTRYIWTVALAFVIGSTVAAAQNYYNFGHVSAGWAQDAELGAYSPEIPKVTVFYDPVDHGSGGTLAIVYWNHPTKSGQNGAQPKPAICQGASIPPASQDWQCHCWEIRRFVPVDSRMTVSTFRGGPPEDFYPRALPDVKFYNPATGEWWYYAVNTAHCTYP
jgi:hypothetical protein